MREGLTGASLRLHDIVTLKKPHPCGSREWEVLRTGTDIRLRCCGCGHEVMLPRLTVEKSLRGVKRAQPDPVENSCQETPDCGKL